MNEITKPILLQDLGMIYPSPKSKYKIKYGIYECPVCKRGYKTMTYDINKGKSTKCQSCATRIKNTTHGLRNTNIYRTWCNMISRTTNINASHYEYYGGRGIVVCNEWRNDFKAFYDWGIMNGYQKELSIDRINNDLNYEPSNCRWVKRETQQQNTRLIHSNNTSGYRGVSFNRRNKKWVSKINFNKKNKHIGEFSQAKDAGIAYDTFIIVYGLEHPRNFM